MTTIGALHRYYAQLSDEDLLQLAARDADGFRPEALDLLRAELRRRQIGLETPQDAGGPQYAGFLVRLAARIVDQIFLTIVAVPCLILGMILVALVDAASGRTDLVAPEEAGRFAWLDITLSVGGWVAYFTICEGFDGRTLGKLLLGLVVVRTDLTPVKPGPALRRSFLVLVDAIALGAPAALSMHYSTTRQRLGDRSADTVVVWRRSLPPPSARPTVRSALVIAAASIAFGGLVVASMVASNVVSILV